MQSIQQLFSKNYILWSQKERQEIQLFFLNNQYFASFYQNKKFNQIAKLCFYRQLQPGQKILLQNNNRAQAIILLEGDITIKKKQRKRRKPSKIKKQQSQNQPDTIHYNDDDFQYTFLSNLTKQNQTQKLNSESMIESSIKNKSKFIFVPCSLYYHLLEVIQHQRVEKIQKVLEKYFFRLNKKQLHELSQSNCIFRQYKMNSYIYRACSKPQEVYALLQGTVRLQKPGFSAENLKQTIIISSNRLFGETDICQEQRTRNAIVCSAFVEILTIPKTQFLKFSPKAFPDLNFQTESLSPSKLPKINSDGLRLNHSFRNSPQKSNLLPFLKNRHFHQKSIDGPQLKRSDSQQKRQYNLIKNSHMLLDLKQKPKKRFELKNYYSSPKSQEQLKNIKKRQKQKLAQLKLQNKFNFENSLIYI